MTTPYLLPSADDGDPTNWNRMADTMMEARYAAFSLPADEYNARTAETVGLLYRWLPEEGTIGELGCGPGRLLTPFARRRPLQRFVGIDSATNMLRHAWTAIIEDGVADRCQVILSDGGSVPVPSLAGLYTVAVLQHTPHYLASRLFAAASMALAPGGTFMYQYVDETHGRDECHWSAEHAESMATRVGLDVVAHFHAILPDWGWVIAERPA